MICSCPVGVRSRTATLLSLRDISPDRGISHGSAPTIVTDRLALSETSAPSVILQSKMPPPPFF